MGWTCWKLSSLMASSKLLLQSEAKSGCCCCLDDQGQEIWSEEEILLGWALGTAKKAKSISLTSEFCRDSHIIIFILRFHFRMRKWQELSRWKRFFAPQSLWMDPRPRGHFSCLLLENILLMVLLPFFTPSSLQKDAVCWAAKTHCKNQLWQVLMEKSFDKWPPLIPDNMFHVMSTYPLFGVMVERKDGRGSAQIVFG